MHSVGEYRTPTLGYTERQRSSWWRTRSERAESESSPRDLRVPVNGDFMSQDSHDEIPEQTSAPGGVRGKYFERYMQGTNVVLLAPDVAEAFHDSETVNAALRRYLAEHGAPPGRSVG